MHTCDMAGHMWHRCAHTHAEHAGMRHRLAHISDVCRHIWDICGHMWDILGHIYGTYTVTYGTYAGTYGTYAGTRMQNALPPAPGYAGVGMRVV